MSMPKGFKHTDETRAKMAISARKRWEEKPRTAESNAKVGQSLKAYWAHVHAEQEAIEQAYPRCKPTLIERVACWIGGK